MFKLTVGEIRFGSTKISGICNPTSYSRLYSSFKVTPPTYFQESGDIPKTLNQIRAQQEQHLRGTTAKAGLNSAISSSTSSHTEYRQPIPRSFSVYSPKPPSTYTSASTSVSNTVPPNNNDKPEQAHFSTVLKESGKGLLFATVATIIIVIYVEQEDKIRDLEKQTSMLKKKQKDMLIHVQTMKKQVMTEVVESNKRNILTQGRMQMHIALLKKQLEGTGMDPVNVSTALLKFEEEIKMESHKQGINLWVPSEASMKSYIPDAHEYQNRS